MAATLMAGYQLESCIDQRCVRTVTTFMAAIYPKESLIKMIQIYIDIQIDQVTTIIHHLCSCAN